MAWWIQEILHHLESIPGDLQRQWVGKISSIYWSMKLKFSLGGYPRDGRISQGEFFGFGLQVETHFRNPDCYNARMYVYK